MASVEEFRRNAVECRRLAQQAHRVKDRETLLRMAEAWDELIAWASRRSENEL